ncbi:helix-turn-helix transcriptional regulator [Rhizobium anhuiense]
MTLNSQPPPEPLGCRRRRPLFLGIAARLLPDILLASVVADHGATECDLVMKEWILSPLERTCLRWISRGRNVDEIALIEGKSVVDIESFLESALVELKANSIKEALQNVDLNDYD